MSRSWLLRGCWRWCSSSRSVASRPWRRRRAGPCSETSPSRGTTPPRWAWASTAARSSPTPASPSARATGTREQAGRSYERARWTAPWQMSDFAYTELIASWAATTPGDSWLEVEVRGRNSKGVTSSWDLLGRWTSGDKFVRRTTESPQSDDLAAVDVDTWKVRGTGGLVSWQVRLSLFRKPGSTGPTVAWPRRDDEPSPARHVRGRLRPRPAGRHRARRAGVLADGALRPLPAVGWRRRGVVLADVDLDGARLLRRAAAAVHLPLRARRAPGSLGRLRRPQDLRRGVRRHRQLAVQHRVRRPARRRRLRHPAPVAARGRGVHRRGHPARRLGLLGRGRADRRPGVVLQRPPAS